jgi:endonuclease/exonuclease/phosphatase (EEP) superfamily protein YafD
MRRIRIAHTKFLVPALFALLACVSSLASAAEDPRGCALALSQPNQENHALEQSFEILSWNIQKASNTGWSEDLTNLAGGADLVFIQEASLQAGIPDLLTGVPALAFAPGYRTAAMDTGVMTLSSAMPTLSCRLTAMEPWLGTPKATSVTEHSIAGRTERLLTVNLHAVNFALGIEDFEAQFDAIGLVLDRHSGPVIFAGDLNTWSEARQKLVDAFMEAHGLRAVRFEPDLRTTAFGRALDHIYVRGLRAESAEVVPVNSSDHNPLQVRLSLDS